MAGSGTTIDLVRHGETDFNREGRWQGSGSDPPLNARGVEQAQEVARALTDAPIIALYTSPLLRARQTAQPIAAALRLEPRIVPALTEMSHGRWEGLNEAEILADWAAEHAAFETDPVGVRRPGGESYGDLAERLWPALETIAGNHAGSRVVVITHGGPIRLVLSRLLDRPLTERESFGTANGARFTVVRDTEGWRLLE